MNVPKMLDYWNILCNDFFDDEIGNLTQLNITEFCCIPTGILSLVDDSLRHNVDIVFLRADTRDSRDFFMVKMKTEFQIF